MTPVSALRTREDIGVAILLACFFAICLWVSSGKAFWLDELFTWYQVRDKTLADLNAAADTGFNLIPLGHFLLLWLLDQTGCMTEWTARLISITAMTGGLWMITRIWCRVWGTETALVLACILIGSSVPLLAQAIEVRPYAIAFLLAIIALDCALTMGEDSAPRRVLLLNALCSFALPFFSYPSGLYSAALLAGFLLSCLTARRRPSLPVVGSFILGWALFLLVSGRTLLAQIAGNRAGLQNPPPHLADLFSAYSSLVSFPLGVIAVLLLARATSRRPADADSPTSEKSTPGIAWYLVLWLLVPVLFFVLSKVSIATVWQERYLLGTAGAIVSTAPLLATGLWRGKARPRWLTFALVAAAIASLLANATALRRAETSSPVLQFAKEIRGKFDGVPVVVTEFNTYFHLVRYTAPALDVRMYVGAGDNHALERIHPHLRSMTAGEIAALPRFVVLVGGKEALAGELLERFHASGLKITKTRPDSIGLIREIWQVERTPALAEPPATGG